MIHWALIGCGDIADKRVAPAILAQKQSCLHAAVSPYEEQLEAFVNKHHVKKGYADVESMLEDPNVDAVYVATPIFLHYDFAKACLDAKKHVLVEKPMAMNNNECEELIDTAKRNKVKLGVSYFRRFFPKLAEVKRLIDEGTIGDVIMIRILFHSWYNPSKEDPKYWRVIKNKGGGGPLWDMGSHKFDMLVDLMGLPKSVCAKMSTQTHDYEVEDSCSALLTMENGAHCSAQFFWNSKVWTDEFEILGTDGKIVLKPCDGDGISLEVPPQKMKGMGSETTSVLKFNHSNVHFPLIDDFADAVYNNRSPVVTGEEGYKTNQILAALERAAMTGQTINL